MRLVTKTVLIEVFALYRRPCSCRTTDVHEKDGRFRCGTCDAPLIRRRRTT